MNTGINKMAGFEFDDLPEGEIEQQEKMVNVTVKLPQDLRDTFANIAHRERRNMMSLGTIVIEEYIKTYVENYKKKSASEGTEGTEAGN